MANPAYGTLLNTANRLIEGWGQPATIKRRTRSGGPDHNPSYTWEDIPCNFVETDNKLTDRSDTLIEQDDVFGLVSMENVNGDTVTLQSGDKFVIDGDPEQREFNFVKFEPLNPGGVQLLTEIHIR